jgi:hypothetical protein
MLNTLLIRLSTNQLKSANSDTLCSLPRYFHKLNNSSNLEQKRNIFTRKNWVSAFDKSRLDLLGIYYSRKTVSISKKKLLFSDDHIRMTQPCVNYFAHSFIDRCSDKRKDKQFIEEQMKSDKAVYILFHVDKPFVKINDSKSKFSLCKLNYSQVNFLLEKAQTNEQESSKISESSPCTCVFLGLQYEKNPEFFTDETQSSCSPYSNPGLYNNKSTFTPWFAIDTSGYDSNLENVSKNFLNEGEFFEGNFLRMMAIQDELESSIIAQVSCYIITIN